MSGVIISDLCPYIYTTLHRQIPSDSSHLRIPSQLVTSMVWLFWFVLVISSSLAVARRPTEVELLILEASVSEDSCAFYNRLEFMIPCDKDGYTINFGLKYCEAYLSARNEFVNKPWQNGVRVCLQRAMLSKLRNSSDVSCSQIQGWGFNSHYDCYMRPVPNSPEITFCRMKSGADIRKIIDIAKGEMFKPQVMIQMSKMAVTCAGQYLQDVHQDFGVFLKKLIAQLG